LTARSSASFISDPNLMTMVDMLGHSDQPAPQVDLFDTQTSLAALH
jgi:hypothetical protein